MQHIICVIIYDSYTKIVTKMYNPKDSNCARHDVMFAVLALIVAILVISAIVDHLNRKCPQSSDISGHVRQVD